eukprot:scaffold207_cov345-Pavlova_lutheri.AAC.26
MACARRLAPSAVSDAVCPVCSLENVDSYSHPQHTIVPCGVNLQRKHNVCEEMRIAPGSLFQSGSFEG